MFSFIENARAIKAQVYIAYKALKDKRTPWSARLVLLFTVAYVLSPVDLIPDFIPVLGLLDDVVLVPLLIKLALRFIPEELKQELTQHKHTDPIQSSGLSRLGLLIVVMIWLLLIVSLFRAGIV